MPKQLMGILPVGRWAAVQVLQGPLIIPVKMSLEGLQKGSNHFNLLQDNVVRMTCTVANSRLSRKDSFVHGSVKASISVLSEQTYEIGHVPELKSASVSSTSVERSFQSLPLPGSLLKKLHSEGLALATEVQFKAIPILLEGHDAAIQSYTGSGKTLAYLLPVLSRVGPYQFDLKGSKNETELQNKQGVEAVIVAPSRELAMQIVREAERILGDENRKMVQQLIGGANVKRQEEALKKNKPLLVVGTPGRISEVSRAGKLHTHGCRFLVLDEADQLLSPKFRSDMLRILEHVGQQRNSEHMDDSMVSDSKPFIVDPVSAVAKEKNFNRVERQTILVSATMPTAVLRAASRWGNKPVLVKPSSIEEVDMKPKDSNLDEKSLPNPDIKGVRESLPPNLTHYYLLTQIRHRVDALRKCIHALDAQSVLVFMNFSRRLKDTEFKLQARSISAGSLHGEQGKQERANILAAFRSKKLRVLVVSEMGARGLDIPDCDLVINLELPTDGAHYAHRGGRTGRMGRHGTVISICEQREEFVFRKFQQELGISIERCEVADGKLFLYNTENQK